MPGTAAAPLCRSAPLLHRGPAPPPRLSLGQGLRQLCLATQELPEPSNWALRPFTEENCDGATAGEPLRRSKFVAAGAAPVLLTPCAPPQEPSGAIPATQRARPPRPHPPPREPDLSAASRRRRPSSIAPPATASPW
jgi:hypothetical protein